MPTERPCPDAPMVIPDINISQPDARDDRSNDTPKIIAFLEGQVQDLKSQLEKSEQRETALIEEKKELRDLRKNEQAPTLALSPPEKPTFWQRLTGR